MNKFAVFARLAAVMTLISAQASPAMAQQQSSSTTTFEDWTMTCATPAQKEGAALKDCEVHSTLLVQDPQTGQEGVAAVVAVVRQLPGDEWRVVVQVPISARLDAPVALGGALDKPIVALGYIGCQPQLCTAAARLTPAQLAQFNNLVGQLYVSYQNQGGQSVVLKAPINGLAAALDSLAREQRP